MNTAYTADTSLSSLEDASADLYTSEVFIEAGEKFLTSIEHWIDLFGMDRKQVRELHDLGTMLLETRDKVDMAKGKIDQFVKDEFTRRRAAKAAA